MENLLLNVFFILASGITISAISSIFYLKK